MSRAGPRKKTSLLSEFRTLKEHYYSFRFHYLAGLFFLLITDAGQIIIPRLLGKAVDTLSEGNTADNTVRNLMLLVIALALVVTLGRFVWRNLILGSARKIENTLRLNLYSKLLTLSGSFYSRYRTGDLMSRATRDLQSVRMASGMALAAFVDSMFMILVILVTLFVSYGRLGLLLSAPLPLVIFLVVFLGRFIGPRFVEVQKNFARISEHVQETLSGIRVVKAFVAEKKKLKEFRAVNSAYTQASMHLTRLWGIMFPLMGFATGFYILLLLYFGGREVMNGHMGSGDFVALLFYAGMLLWSAAGLGWFFSMAQRGAASMKRINAVLNEEPDITDLPGAVETAPPGDLEFRRLCYSYKDLPPVLKDVSFTVPRGTSMGILGSTGSGKTTLLKILSRLLDPPPGSVFIGKTDIRSIKRSSLRGMLGMAVQDVFLFSETIRDNILFSRPDASEEELEAVINAAGLTADLPYFPEGLDTVAGERGVTLSGGQRQRIAMARALLTNPEILILDDSLSAVDAHTEEHILNAVIDLRRGKITLMVSHRISALSRCDSIVVLENGSITARGTHEELINTEGFYRRIAMLQNMEQKEEAQ